MRIMSLRELESALSRSPSSVLSSISSSLLQRNARPIKPINGNSTRRLSMGSSGPGKAREDEGRFRNNKLYLTVTDIMSWEWCSKQAEFKLSSDKCSEPTKAMSKGKDLHHELEEYGGQGNEPVRNEGLRNEKCRFDGNYSVAKKFLKFIEKTKQLPPNGFALIREVPIVSIVEEIWIFGKIDEIRLPDTEIAQPPMLVENKTRSEDNAIHPPPEPQKRNARLQLMCYKYLWDNSVAGNFPMDQFFNDLELNPDYSLPPELQARASNLGSPVKTLKELVMLYRNTCCRLRPASDDLMLRYFCQTNRKLLSKDEFKYDYDWLKSQVKGCIEFWRTQREADYVSEEERWKCIPCEFAKTCRSNTNTNNATLS